MTSVASRASQVTHWLDEMIQGPYTLHALTGDASFRRYHRLAHAGQTYIVMDVPPECEDQTPFDSLGRYFYQKGIKVPKIIHSDLSQGLLLLEDFGQHHLADVLAADNVGHWYGKALEQLHHWQQCDWRPLDLPTFGAEAMLMECHRTNEWLLDKALNISGSHLEGFYEAMALEISTQPTTLVHRDYHCRNLMVLPDECLGIIDFQDALEGPLPYDMVSLLKDCYVRWPREQVLTWLRQAHERYYQSMCDFDTFVYWFDLVGLQRHLKVLGIFTRLYLRDKKSRYLQDMPLVHQYVLEALSLYPAKWKPIQQWYQQTLSPALQAWLKEQTCEG